MIQAVIFDYGSVLSRTLDPHPRAAWEHKLGLRAGDLQRIVHNEHAWIAAQQGHITPEAHWRNVGTTLALAPAELLALRASFYQGDVVNEELVAYIDRLRATGIHTALLSNFSTELRGLLTRQDLAHRFDPIAVSAEIGVMKPDATAYRMTLDRLGLPANACIFVDDQPVNVDAARSLGLHGIVFRNNPTCLRQLDSLLTGAA